ncbi:MAG: TonB-dependent receptor [Acidimicrobiia bacterium]|nr:TonB-dependent receptor [Acidimicrobiia bacterium]
MKCTILLVLSWMLAAAAPAFAQATGVIRGQVSMGPSRVPAHHADVVIPKLDLHARSDEDGRFELTGIPPGAYQLVAHMHNLSDEQQKVELKAGEVVVVDFHLRLSPLRQQVTVTASGKEESTLETFLSAASVNSLELAGKASSTSLGELVEDQAGVSKRSFGPGTSRPVIRGFDGDRVLVLADGIRTGTLSSQSGDHGEPVDGNSVERVELVRGPATLLYGSSAIGGVINTISRHHEIHEHPHDGIRGHLSATAGTANAQGGGSGNFEYGRRGYMLWGGGAGMRTGDYGTPLGVIANSGNKLSQASIGFGRFRERDSVSLGYGVQDGAYGVPAEEGGHEDVRIAYRRQHVRFSGTIHEAASWLERAVFKVNYTDWKHRELEGEEIGTRFFNKQLIFRTEFEQKPQGMLSGRFGVWGMRRDFRSAGEEALAPPVDQNSIAVFGLEELSYKRARCQFGGRVERNSYDPQEQRRRAFTAASASAGVNLGLGASSALVATYTHAVRAPALEELYNRGPHLGNVTFEIGDTNLKNESSDGIDIALRRQSGRIRGEVNFFYYRLSNFIFLAPTGEIEDGLPVAEYLQQGSRYLGGEYRVQAQLKSWLWVNSGVDAVNARLRGVDASLPRIPPLRGRVGFDLRLKNANLRPELVLANRQGNLFENETPTAGYAALSIGAGYNVASQHALHVITVQAFNLTDRLYRNHLSFIKQFAPEIGRGVRLSYHLYFF